ncbi:MAG: nucleotide pyrophosphatase/phosphodiesterase family protein [Verrucomicrobiales bacterium]
MQRSVVLNIAGLSRRLIGEDTPSLNGFMESNSCCFVEPAFPAVTCTAQATYLTGKLPSEHGIVANGWYDSSLAEHQFWRQSNHLVGGAKLWEVLQEKDPEFTCAKIFWWFNMYSTADFSITPRPIYPADGRKVFDIYTCPMDMREQLKADLGDFPFPAFWGPAAGISSSRWIADSAMWIEEQHHPSLSLVYLPHLDYSFQKTGPGSPEAGLELRRLDRIFGELLTFYQRRNVGVVVLSEYGITPVNRPVHINRVFRQRGWLAIKDELGREMIDLGASQAFAIADHQVAHIYVNDKEIAGEVLAVTESIEGVDEVLSGMAMKDAGVDHWRSGDFVAVADAVSWFTYYYWEDDQLAPDYARCVDIHRKPGYDPVELFIDPEIRFPKLKIGLRLARKKLGLRMLMDVVPLDAGLVKGSHGREPEDKMDWPVMMGNFKDLPTRGVLPATEVFDQLLGLCSGECG